MPASTEPNSGLRYGWTDGEDGWGGDRNDDIAKTGRVLTHLSVKDRDVTDPSTLTPSDGDRYIVASNAIGDWAGQDGNVAVYDNASTAWVFYTPNVGWLAYIEDEEARSEYKSTGWSSGINLTKTAHALTQLSVIDRDITDPSPLTPTDGDTYIVATSAVGNWSGQDGNVAVYDGPSAAWVFYTPSIGWIAYVQDEEVLSAYKAAGWSAGIAI